MNQSPSFAAYPSPSRRLTIALVGLLVLPLLRAQESRPAATIQPAPAAKEQSQQELQDLRTKKLAKDVFTKAAWRLDYDAARAEAKANDQMLLVYFTRSYAH